MKTTSGLFCKCRHVYSGFKMDQHFSLFSNDIKDKCCSSNWTISHKNQVCSDVLLDFNKNLHTTSFEPCNWTEHVFWVVCELLPCVEASKHIKNQINAIQDSLVSLVSSKPLLNII